MYKDINALLDREAMGLAQYYQPSKLDDLKIQFQKLQSCSVQELMSITESKTHNLPIRYAAGQLLALLGDPRIETTHPVMVKVPAAEVMIGIAPEKVDAVMADYSQVGVLREWIMKETPAFTVKLPAFHIRKYLVTNQEYRDFLLETHHPELPTSWEFSTYPLHKANHPVYTVSEQAAEAYAAWLSVKTKRAFRLPSEFEWEYAASGASHFEYPWGNHYHKGFANTVEEQIYQSTPVGIFPHGNSPFGLCDMAGNVEEYTADDYQPYPGAAFIEDDLAVNAGTYRIARGGSFTRHADLARTTRRHGRYDKAIYVMGFRLVESI
jgi:formylglycine-generating enzyme required for sulfatase activity